MVNIVSKPTMDRFVVFSSHHSESRAKAAAKKNNAAIEILFQAATSFHDAVWHVLGKATEENEKACSKRWGI